ncbi:hypothetical protein [Nocardioides aurantiacus]|uniref:hypothetical protein n=1 Tax=Nocardioides aurantiacus TaxID=86796 RepID=UPI00403F8DF7
MSHVLARLAAAGTLTALVLGGAAAPALADDSVPAPTCDVAALTASVDAASVAARAAQKAFTDHGRGSVHQQAERHRAHETREARDAAKAARTAAREAADTKGEAGKEAREVARAAAAKARVEAREAAAAKRASDRQLKAAIKAERTRLKAAWDLSKKALQDARGALEDCAEATPAPPVTTEPVAP